MSTIEEMRGARQHLAVAVATRVDGRSATINTGQMKIWLEMVDAYLGNAQVALPPIGWITRDANEILSSGSIISTRTDVFAVRDEKHTVPVYAHPPKLGECALGVGDDLEVYGSHSAIKIAQGLIADGRRLRQMDGDHTSSALRDLPPATTRPTQSQVQAAYARFLEINDGDADKAKTDLGTWVIGQQAAQAVTA